MHRTLVCFDFGTKRIGVAVGQELTRTSTALETLNSIKGEPDWQSISRIIEQWRPHALVLGLPLNADGSASTMTGLVNQFSDQLQQKYGLPVYFMDERLSSAEAENQIEDKRVIRQNKGVVDKVAARIILQSWLEQADEVKNS